MRVEFNGFGRTMDDRRLFAKAELNLVWQAQRRSDNRKPWTITEWRLDTLDTQSVERSLFAEVLILSGRGRQVGTGLRWILFQRGVC